MVWLDLFLIINSIIKRQIIHISAFLKGTNDINKNNQLILSYFGLSVLIIILSTVFIYKWDDTNSSFDNLSINYQDFSVGYNRAIIDEHNYDFTDMLEFILAKTDGFRLQKLTDRGYSWVFISDYSFDFELLRGREFVENDFKIYKNVAMVSEKLSQDTYYYNNIEWIDLDNSTYQVIGVYKLKENSIYKNSEAFLNIISENYISLGNQIEGRYYLDKYNKKKDIMGQINEWCSIIENDNIFDKSFKERYVLTKDAVVIPLAIIFLGLMFIILFIIYITSLWLISLKKETYIRRLCGASFKDIIYWILTKYFKFIFISFLTASIIPIFLSVKIKVLIVSFIILLLVGLINCNIIIFKIKNMKIINLKK